MIGRILREPLVHFLIAGAVLFAVFAAIREPEAAAPEDGVITVDRRALLTHMQYRANAFEPQAFDALLETMTPQERQALIDDYVQEEVLYREARALGLEDSDYIIRRRMVQKMQFLLGDLAQAEAEQDEAALQAYFQEHRRDYAAAPSVTFTHVFFDAERREDAAAAARRAVADLNARGAAFNDAPGGGDRFPFLRNYVERTYDYVASHFGEGFAAALSGLEASDRWQGPVESVYGHHAVLISRRTERRLPELDEVRDDVARDFLQARGQAALDEAAQSLRENYEIEVTAFDAPRDGEAE